MIGRKFIFVVILIVTKLQNGFGCYLNGYDTGICSDKDFDIVIPFCKDVVSYRACLPRYQSLWYNHSALTKDKLVEQMFKKITIQRKMQEIDETLMDKGVNEWGVPGEVVPRLTENPDCEQAMKNYFCYLNFPRCDSEGRSLLMCRSVCENYFIACQQPKSLWRCGEPKYVNGYEAEVSRQQVSGKLLYFRSPFPGSPFRDNQFDKVNEKLPLVVCTPSLANGDFALVVNTTVGLLNFLCLSIFLIY